MKEFDKNEFDEIFRAGLSAPDLNEIDEDWELMKARLQNKKKPVMAPYYLLFISSIAAMFFLVSSLLFNTDEAVQEQTSANVTNAINDAPVVMVPGREDGKAANVPEQSTFQVPGSSLSLPDETILTLPERIYYPAAAVSTEHQTVVSESSTVDLPINTLVFNADSTPLSAPIVQSNVSETLTAENAIVASNTGSDTNSPMMENTIQTEEKSELNEQSGAKKSRLSLAINFAPDLNGVGQIQSDKLSYSVGAGLIYSLSKKVTIEAGASYGRKSYQTGFSSFRPASYNLFPIKPNLVSSGFDVMDIQLNMGYTLLRKGKSTIGVGAGISSYLMLDEQYSFTYQNNNARSLSSFHTGYQNNHFFGIANLNLSYKRNITNNVQLAFDPYFKLPLTTLGYGNIRLRSAGMNVGVITKLNKNKK